MTPSQTTSVQPPDPKPATSVGQVFALVAGFLALAAIGAAIGWTLTNTSGPSTVALSSTSPSITASSAPSHPSTPTPTTKAPKPGQTVPPFTARNVSFITARQQLMAVGVQGVPVFTAGGTGGDTVTRTDPAEGSPMFRGETIKLYVNEPAPVLPVPLEKTKACNAAGSDVARVGFHTEYASGRNGVVLDQSPEPGATAHWNDPLTLTCGSPDSASASAHPSSGASAPIVVPSG